MTYKVSTSSLKGAVLAALSDTARLRALAAANPMLTALTLGSLVLLLFFKLPLLLKVMAIAGIVSGAVAIGLSASVALPAAQETRVKEENLL